VLRSELHIPVEEEEQDTLPQPIVRVPGGESNAMSQQLVSTLVQATQAALVAGGSTININWTSNTVLTTILPITTMKPKHYQ
jgi:hypothetical protein